MYFVTGCSKYSLLKSQLLYSSSPQHLFNTFSGLVPADSDHSEFIRYKLWRVAIRVMWAGHRVRGSCIRTKVFKWVYLSAIWQKNDDDWSSVCPSNVPWRVYCHHVTSAVTKSLDNLNSRHCCWSLSWCGWIMMQPTWVLLRPFGPDGMGVWTLQTHGLPVNASVTSATEVKWSEVTGSEVKWSEDIWMQPEGRADCWCPKVNSHRDLRKQIVDHNSRIQNEETWSDFIIFCRYIQRSDRVSCGPCVVMMSSALSIIWKKNQLLVFIYRSYSGSRRWTRTSPLDCRVQMILADRSVSAAQRQFPQCWVKLCRRTWCFGVQQAGGGAARLALRLAVFSGS